MISLISLAIVLAVASAAPTNVVYVTNDWKTTVITSKTTPTFQAVTNPMYLRDSPIHNNIYKWMQFLNATHVRYQGWFPYPKLAVAELEAPTKNQTTWDFTYMDQMFVDFMKANDGRDPMVSFCTIPQWMFKTPKKVPYPADPKQIQWDYSQGTDLVDGSMKTLGDYYKRVIQWYTQGGFTDELGKYHKSGYKFNIKQFEFLNEVEGEHHMTPQDYTRRYDAVVKSVQEVVPDMKFTGLALLAPSSDGVQYVSYFLNKSNHQANIPLDYISYHFYATSGPNETADQMQYHFFQEADTFIETVKRIEAIRMKLSPTTKTNLDEIGSIMGDAATQPNPREIPDGYWAVSGANYAYVFMNMVKLGIDFVGMSQLVGFPTQYPSVTMLNWTTGNPIWERYGTLQLILQFFEHGDRVVKSTIDDSKNPGVFDVMSAVGTNGKMKSLVVNKRLAPITVNIAIGFDQTVKQVLTVEKHGIVTRKGEECTEDCPDASGWFTFTLPGCGVAVVTYN